MTPQEMDARERDRRAEAVERLRTLDTTAEIEEDANGEPTGWMRVRCHEWDDITDARDVALELTNEVKQLQAWKDSAMAVFAEWDATWEAAGKPGELGSSKAVALREEVERLTDRIAWLEGVTGFAIKLGDKTFRYTIEQVKHAMHLHAMVELRQITLAQSVGGENHIKAGSVQHDVDRLKESTVHLQMAMQEIIDVAHKHGWNGVENPKKLADFLDRFLPDDCTN